MTEIILVRHGQAKLSMEAYGGLTTRGVAQARRLGEHFVALGRAPDRVYVEPRARHLETAACIAERHAAASRPWPQAITAEALDEYPAEQVMRHGLPVLAARDPALAKKIDAAVASRGDQRRAWTDVFHAATRAWVRGELDVPQAETWPRFRARVRAGVDAMMAGGGVVVAVTSGGPIASIVGHALGLDDEAVLELSWHQNNGAASVLTGEDGRLALRSFNALPLVVDPDLVTTI